MADPTKQLSIFLKAPRPGQVKTRLASSIGPQAACEIYHTLVRLLCERLRPLQEVELRFAPDDAEAEISPWKNQGWSAAPQGAGGLGMRLAAAFDFHFHKGKRSVVIIGSDCPEVTVADVEDAWESLKAHDLVLGPTDDGGYWLVGLNRPCPALFDGIAWSTEQVFQQTLRKANAQGLKLHCLRPLSDIDTESDWKKLQERRGAGSNTG